MLRSHVDAAFWSPSMVGMHPLIDAYRRRDLQMLGQLFTDQPVGFLRDIWERERKKRASCV